MAQQPVPFTGLSGQPTAPGTILPDAYQHISSSPADFGGLVGQAEGGLGQAFGQAGQAAFQIQTQYDQAAASQAFVNLDQGLNKIGHGDPNDPNSKGYFGLQGSEAMGQYGSALDQAEQLRQQVRSQIPSRQAQQQFDQDSHRLIANFQAQAGDWRTRQQTVYQGQQQDALIASDKSSAIIDPFNDQQFLARGGDMQNAVLAKATAQGWSQDVTNQQLAIHTSDLYRQRTMAMAEQDPTAAWNFYLKSHNAFTGTDAIDVERQLDSRILAQQSRGYGQKIMAGQPVPGVGSMSGDPAMAPTALASIPDANTRSMAMSAANAAGLPAAAIRRGSAPSTTSRRGTLRSRMARPARLASAR